MIRALHDRLVELEGRALARFNDWFTSQGGVYQTFLVTVSIVIAERAFPHLDPSGFYLLYWLTVYSAVTQPALAYAGTVAAANADAHARALNERLARIEAHLGITEAA